MVKETKFIKYFKRTVIGVSTTFCFVVLVLVIKSFIPEEPQPDGPYYRYFYDNKHQVEVRGAYLNNLHEGEWVRYYLSGRVKEEGSYHLGNKTGNWFEYYDRDENKLSKVTEYHPRGDYTVKEFCYEGGINFFGRFKPIEEVYGRVMYSDQEVGVHYHFHCDPADKPSQPLLMEVNDSELKRLKSKIFYLRGEQHGEITHYHANGQLSNKFYAKSGVLEGKYLTYDYLGRIAEEGRYQDGEKQGRWSFYEEGKLLKEEQYQRGLLAGRTVYHENGQVSAEGTLANVDNGNVHLPHWTWVYYHDTGKVESKGGLLQGNRHGQWLFYDQEGRVEQQGHYVDGEKHGTWLSFEQGREKTLKTYQYSVLEGIYKEYHENGQVYIETTMHQGYADGPYKFYHSNGQVAEAGTFISGNKQGEFIQYYENGQIRGKSEYRDGYYNGDFISYYENGKIRSQGAYKINVVRTLDNSVAAGGQNHEGVWTYYYDNGQLRRKGAYENNGRIGLWYYYNENGVQTELRLYDHKLRFQRMLDEDTPLPNSNSELDMMDSDYYTLTQH
ncbi:toxin-antitoxin system YwqK family antitoxin [Motilimonas eburnea]|uniref:toxin-antitoxin system YwqK family antitoxin n=1 Tax=Motilimonas eburnea TaxID=1737488 RepID=UPI001E38DBDF|nr:toxin-antitoxin system YwqK family antitoxin [Motilimonas eburnea]MCE2573442.1 hypothetical protein [Motilimonas eburnea]